MGVPGHGAGERRIDKGSSSSPARLPSELSSELREQDRYWWTYSRLEYLVSYVKDHGIETPAQWKRLAAISHLVSGGERDYLYRELRSLFSESSLSYLFGSDYIASRSRIEGVRA